MEQALILTLLFILGTIVGSFLNVVILRLNTGRSVSGRSSCANCGKTLTALELIPIFSFLFLVGKCRDCKSNISWQYPAVELGTGILFATTFARLLEVGLEGSLLFCLIFLALFIISILVVIFVYDLRHLIIPDILSLLLFLSALVWRVSLYFAQDSQSLWDFLIAPTLFLVFFLFWYLSRGKLMGLGDAKLAAGLGLFLGFLGGIWAVMLAFWIGAIVSVPILLGQNIGGRLPLLAQKKRLTIKSEVPFAPFLIAGTLISFFFDFNLPHAIFFS